MYYHDYVICNICLGAPIIPGNQQIFLPEVIYMHIILFYDHIISIRILKRICQMFKGLYFNAQLFHMTNQLYSIIDIAM